MTAVAWFLCLQLLINICWLLAWLLSDRRLYQVEKAVANLIRERHHP